ncbi:MAG: hypothetical protein L3J19_06265 [Sulfurimonas sp.]|nr:hypothetical protein [Sulfurimonas sp.]
MSKYLFFKVFFDFKAKKYYSFKIEVLTSNLVTIIVYDFRYNNILFLIAIEKLFLLTTSLKPVDIFSC